MIRANKRRSAVVLAFFLASFSVFAQFEGEFTGYYAPSKWTTILAGNAQYQNTATAERQQGNKLLTISGAVSAQATTQLPASVIDYTITLAGAGLQPVAFSYLFTAAADGNDLAQLIYDSGSGFQVIANFSTLIGSQQAYIGQLQAGRPFGFRVYSNNDNVADTLVISIVPEPSALTLLGLGASALLWRLRRPRI